MARGLVRVREMSIRRALGAGTRTLLGQLAVESSIVGLIGGGLGLALAWTSLEAFQRWTEVLPRGQAIEMDLRVFAFAMLVAGSTAFVFGLLPALKTVGRDINHALGESGRGATGGRALRFMRGGLVVGEVGLSLVLVAMAGLLLRSFVQVTSQDAGLDAQDVWVLQLNPVGVASADDYRFRMQRILEALEDLPAVQSATYGIEMPFETVGGDRCCWSTDVTVVGGASEPVRTAMHPVTEDFFATLGTRLVRGSGWSDATVATEPPPAVPSEALAMRLFGSASNALGKELAFGRGTVRVSGVAEPTLHYGLDQYHGEALYLPIEVMPFPLPKASFALRVSDRAEGVARSAREAVWAVEPDLPVPTVVPLSRWIDDSAGVRRFASMLFSAFGGIALLLAAGGLYGTLLYAVRQRRRELGIRLALGAGRRQIQNQVVGRGMALALVGVTVGVLAAWFFGRLLESQLFGVGSRDPISLTGSVTVLLLTAALASWLPAHRASRTDPLETLRTD